MDCTSSYPVLVIYPLYNPFNYIVLETLCVYNDVLTDNLYNILTMLTITYNNSLYFRFYFGHVPKLAAQY